MNKFWGVLFFTVALIVSWNIIHSETAIGAETHVGIQAQLRDLILNTVQSKRPDARNLRVNRLWTEVMNENKVRAVFTYTFEEVSETGTPQEQSVDGEAVLHREPSDDVRLDRWALQSVRTTNNNILFAEGSVITPNASAEDETDPTAPAGEAAPAPEQ